MRVGIFLAATWANVLSRGSVSGGVNGMRWVGRESSEETGIERLLAAIRQDGSKWKGRVVLMRSPCLLSGEDEEGWPSSGHPICANRERAHLSYCRVHRALRQVLRVCLLSVPHAPLWSGALPLPDGKRCCKLDCEETCGVVR